MQIVVTGYPVVAEARGHRTLWYRQFGSYQGEWLLFSEHEDHYWVWRGSYGSCSGCDAFEAHFFDSDDDHEYDSKDPIIQDFIKDYTPFLKLRPDAALNIAMRDDSILSVLPRNQRDWYDIPREEVGRQLALIVKGQAGKLTPAEILDLDNQEIRRDAIEAYGSENFIRELEPQVREETEEGVLYVIERAPEDYAFLYVKDPSTERRYVLRVDPAHQTVRAARASTFGYAAGDFVLAQET